MNQPIQERRSIQLGDHIRVLKYIPTLTPACPVLKEGERYKLSGMVHSESRTVLRFVAVDEPGKPFVEVSGVPMYWEWLDRWVFSAVEKQMQFGFMRRVPRKRAAR